MKTLPKARFGSSYSIGLPNSWTILPKSSRRVYLRRQDVYMLSVQFFEQGNSHVSGVNCKSDAVGDVEMPAQHVDDMRKAVGCLDE